MPLVQTRGAASAQGFGEFAQVTAVNYIEDVFSCFLYTGTSASQTITNGIDLSGKGGLVVIKGRDSPTGSSVYGGTANQFTWQDTVRGITQTIFSNRTDAQLPAGGFASNGSISSTGFTLNYNGYNDYNRSPNTYVSWTFRKQPKFFDVVTWTGNATNRTIAHSLGSVPGSIIVKRTDTTADWAVYHRSLANTQYLVLNTTAAAATGATWWNSTTPTSAVFSVGTDATVNASGGTYVAYIFAHDAGGFGLTGTDNVISCGSVSYSNTQQDVNLGYEPQWILWKKTSNTGDWWMFDTMRGLVVDNGSGTGDKPLYANLSNAEGNTYGIDPTATGFQLSAGWGSGDYIYIAIRRGPMKVPTSGTSVYATSTSDTVNNPEYISNFPVDMEISTNVTYGGNRNTSSRLLQGTFLFTNSTNAESAGSQYDFSYMNGWATNAIHDSAYRSWMWRRAPSFFDEVCYTGNSTPGTTITHNLGVAPELIIVKQRNASRNWIVGNTSVGWTKFLQLNSTTTPTTQSDIWTDTDPTSTVFTVGSSVGTNQSGSTYVAYLFATCAGVSKCTAFTGTGTLQTIDCGFTSGARFVLVKRTDSTGDWYVWDSSRGLSSSTDPYLLLNSTAAEVTSTNWVDTTSTGFQVTAASGNNVNINGASYIALAIA